nr:hypothetical protein [Tanacetum cinerariifolium]
MNAFIILKTPFQKFFQSEFVNTYNSKYEARKTREDFRQDTQMEAQTFRDLIIQNMDSIEKSKQLKELVDNLVYKESSGTRSGTNNVSSSSKNEFNIKENENSVSRNECTISEEKINNDEYNVFSMDKEHPKQHESVNDTYLVEQGDTNTTLNSSDMSNNGREVDQDDDLAKERDFLASLIE